MLRFIFILFSLISTLTGSVHAQNVQDTIPTAASEQIDKKQIELEVMRKQQQEDSLHRLRLEDQLLRVQRNDFEEKKKLVEEINLLKSRDSLIVNRRKLKVDSLRKLNNGIGVSPFGDTLFRVYNAVGSYTAAERAAAITQRMKTLAANIKFDTDSLTIQKNEENWLLLWQDQIILSINQQDALWANMDAETLVRSRENSIKTAVDQYREETSVKRMLEAVALATLILFILVLIIYSIGKFTLYLRRKTLLGKGRLFHGIKIRGYVLVSASKQIKFIWTLLAILRWILIISAIYLALPLLLNLFPQTEGYAPVLLGYFLSPLRNVALAVFSYLPNLITIFVICFVFHYLLKLLKFFAQELQNEALTIPGFYKEWALPTYHILRVLLLAFLLVVIFPYLPGSESPIFKGISVFIGVLFTFSSAGALGNIVAGLLLTYMRSFSLGDRIRIGDVSGDIIEKSLLVTRIRTIKNEVVSIPNAQILSNHTINYSADAQELGLIVHVVITLSYEVPWQQVHELAKKAAAKNSRLEKTPEPFVLQTGLDDFYVSYQLNGYTKLPNQQALIYSDLYKDILDVFHEAGIEILSPHYHAVRDGSSRDMPQEFKSEHPVTEPIRVKVQKEQEQ
ncbi:mechanosensitive ion channel family protein [Sphingobacterium deserti]|uniref:Small-conductance mechanosensitive ionchannel MscS1 n=1 Tax=Sphingobacterium deserti TaxID=1229276 RepID=A0A0B8T138_9SPHI|nr:mechanosensitive ion channel domain-containing protein [Sphingobacterium deserti]KGE12363.1 small-conductance mechanosensitive ionchannel MscS1 [Sphingobacterium deserti]